MNDVLTEVRFWRQVMTDAKRTVLCNPDLESRIRGWVDARGLGGLITVTPSPAVPMDRVFVVDEQAVQASFAQLASRPIRLL